MNKETGLLSEEKSVRRVGATVERPASPWSENIRDFLAHLEAASLPVEHLLKLTPEHEIYRFAPGGMVHPNRWSDEALYEVGRLAAGLHRAGAAFSPASPACKPWCLREIGRERPRIWCHGDIAPWNMITTQDGLPKTLVDWEFSGPLDPLVELARICWLFPQLVDDDLQRLYDLPSPEYRARQVRMICDGYGLCKKERGLLTQQLLEVIVCETAHEAIDPGLTFSDAGCLWGFAWRTRSLYWVWRHRSLLDNALG